MSRIILIATIVLCAGMLAGCLLEEDSGTGSESGQSIVGSWLVTDNDSGNHWLLTFYDDGRYIHYTSSTGTDPCVHNEGAEYGTYTYDTSTDILVTTFSFDDNGCHGLSDNDGASIAVIIVNDSITYNGDVIVFSRIVDSAQPIVGSWLVTDNDSGNHWLLTFYDDGRYIHYTSSTGTDPCVHNEGAEYGTYTYDTSTDILVTTFSFDDNGCHGLSDNDGASIAVIIVNDSMTYNGEVGGFSRIAASE